MPASRFEKAFARVAAAPLADWFGSGKNGATYTGLNQVATSVSHLTVSDERREWRKSQNGYELFFVREGWVIIDPDNARFSGLTKVEMGGLFELDGTTYTVEHAVHGQKLDDFRMTRVDMVERSSPDLRGR